MTSKLIEFISLSAWSSLILGLGAPYTQSEYILFVREKTEGARLVRIYSRRYYIRDTGLAIYQAKAISSFGKKCKKYEGPELWRVGAEISPIRGITNADYNTWMKWVFSAQLYGKTFISKEAALKAVDAVDISFPL